MTPPREVSDDLTKPRQDDATDGRARLLVHWEGGFLTRELPPAGALTFGRSHEADVRIDDASVSRMHARIVVGPGLFIEDLGSSNGTRVGGKTLKKGTPVEIHRGDRVEIGAASVIVDMPIGAAETQVAEPPRNLSLLGGPMTLVERAAPTDLPVLFVGETGVGKEVLARALQAASPRARAPFVRLNCAALSESLLESELFGHERGAFTGADHAKPGLLETADGGTLFLDEIGELPLGAQAKLLRVIESGEVTRVGAVRPRSIDVRFVMATNRDLQRRISEGAFRQDLFFRINGVTIAIPPLRERKAEIGPLAALFSEEAAGRIGKRAIPFDAAASKALVSYDWPGNVRELRHVVERAVLMFQPEQITLSHLPPELLGARAAAVSAAPTNPPTKRPGDTEERERILAALAEAAGHQGRAAEILGISRRTLSDRLDSLDLPRPRKGLPPPRR